MAHAWAVRAFGRDAAIVLGALDFLDRARATSGEVLATRKRLLGDLDGFVSRKAFDRAISALVDAGIAIRHEREIFGDRNLTVVHEFSLDAEAASRFAAGESPANPNGNADVPKRERRESQTGPGSGPGLGPGSGTPTVIDKEGEREEAAPLAPAASLTEELNLLAASAAARNCGTDGAADRARCREAAEVAAKENLDVDTAAAAIRDLRVRGGWPREAADVLRALAATAKRANAEAVRQKHLAAPPPGLNLDAECVARGAELLARRRAA